VCPATALRHLGWRGSYKGRRLTRQRERILSMLSEPRLLRRLPSPIRRRAIEDAGGDALDCIIVALATSAALRDISLGRAKAKEDCLEGQVFFKL